MSLNNFIVSDDELTMLLKARKAYMSLMSHFKKSFDV